MPPMAQKGPASSPLDLGAATDAELVRAAWAHHAVDGAVPRGVPAGLAALLGCHKSTVSRAMRGANVRLAAAQRARLVDHLRTTAPGVLPPAMRYGTGERRSGGPAPRLGARTITVYLTAEEEARWREACEGGDGGIGGGLARALRTHLALPPSHRAPSPRPAGGHARAWQTDPAAIRALDEATGLNDRPGHARAAILLVLATHRK